MLTDEAIEAQFPGLGDFEGLDVVKDPAQGGRVTKVTILGTGVDPELTGDQFRSGSG
ncbi:hypothetical protein GCM10023066_55590 [Nocardioides kongjuensis]